MGARLTINKEMNEDVDVPFCDKNKVLLKQVDNSTTRHVKTKYKESKNECGMQIRFVLCGAFLHQKHVVYNRKTRSLRFIHTLSIYKWNKGKKQKCDLALAPNQALCSN